MQQNEKCDPSGKQDILSITSGNFSISFSEPQWGSPESLTQEDSPESPDWREIFLCLRGEGKLEIDGRLYCVRRGSVWAAGRSPILWHEYDKPETTLLRVNFLLRAKRDIPEQPDDMYSRALSDFLAGRTNTVGFDPALCDYSDFLRNRIGSKKQFCLEVALTSFLLDCIFSLIEGSPLLSDKEKILVYVTEHAREKITVSDLSKLLSVSDRSLFYFFNENFHTSPNDFINRIRMHSAAECLQRGLSIKEVSDMYKFSESTSFCRMFKKYFGITPTEYQRLAKSGKNTPTEYGGYIDACPPKT
ncbi:MAG: helix-turn-helix transcriptional regulator [Hominenteromicrobium sp.]